MNNLIFIDIKDSKFYKNHSDTASSKPRIDTEIIANHVGFKSIIIYNFFFAIEASSLLIRILRKCKVLHTINNILFYVQSLRFLFIKDSIIFVQYFFFNNNLVSKLKSLKKKNRLIILIHDLESFRSHENRKKEIKILNMADTLIVHSSVMKKTLQEYGCNSNIVILEFFDFISKHNSNKSIDNKQINVLYAGNLTKSKFIHDLKKLQFESKIMKFYLYGRCNNHIFTDNNIIYKGVFSNDNIECVEGNWGLVWDGDSIATCNGINGKYLLINSPYKMSLYLALGIPIIVWGNSAMAEYVKKNHLGICINKLQEIESTILSLSAEEMKIISHNVNLFSQKVRNGEMLENALRKCISIINNSY